jgi:hypothetical protein
MVLCGPHLRSNGGTGVQRVFELGNPNPGFREGDLHPDLRVRVNG